MKNAPRPSVERVRELVSYKDGIVVWRVQERGRRLGASLGAINLTGYLMGVIDRHRIAVHRVVWVLHHPSWPTDQIDHINGIRTDNRIENLRLATPAQNQANQGMRRNNTSGFKGVYWSKQDKKFVARISSGGRRIQLGYYRKATEAHEIYDLASQMLNGEFHRPTQEQST